ncbi:MAG TPA: hypothetical protein VKZ50_05040 [bacterium]|nr:hypothetical protein [bacterium]
MATLSRRKLGETRYFWGLMELERQKALQANWDHFAYLLSAFLSAGRSVTFAVQNEDPDRYAALWTPWLAAQSAEDQALFKFMNRQRREEVHVAGAAFSRETGTIPVADVFIAGATASGAARPPFGYVDDYPVTIEIGTIKPQFEIAGRTVDAVPACRRYVDLLAEFLDRFER